MVKSDVLIAICGIVVVVLFDLVERRVLFWQKLHEYPLYVRWFVYYSLVLAIIIFGRFGAQEFIYFQF